MDKYNLAANKQLVGKVFMVAHYGILINIGVHCTDSCYLEGLAHHCDEFSGLKGPPILGDSLDDGRKTGEKRGCAFKYPP